MKIFKPPYIPPCLSSFTLNSKSVFLAGSIEMGKAEDWQTKFENAMQDVVGFICNPRRDDWDSSWIQTKENVQFRGQVEWELEMLDQCSIIALYFDPKSTSPITLMELGLHAYDNKLIVCCPEGFFRKGNVDIVCERYGIKQVETLDKLIEETKLRLSKIEGLY